MSHIKNFIINAFFQMLAIFLLVFSATFLTIQLSGTVQEIRMEEREKVNQESFEGLKELVIECGDKPVTVEYFKDEQFGEQILTSCYEEDAELSEGSLSNTNKNHE